MKIIKIIEIQLITDYFLSKTLQRIFQSANLQPKM